LLGHETCLGNPYNLKFWAIGKKSANMFVAELGNNMEMEKGDGRHTLDFVIELLTL
jgi:hypothetical protein